MTSTTVEFDVHEDINPTSLLILVLLLLVLR
jgi:hypothetical protein